jgi:MGT family glycosyltransferase
VSRALIVVPPMTGHVNPTVSLGTELTRRGHDVAWVGQADVVDKLLPPEAEFLPVGRELAEKVGPNYAPEDRRGPEGFKFLWEDFLIPYARETAPEVRAHVQAFRPDALVVDQQALAGAVVARLEGLRWATSATTSAELVDPFARMPKIEEWVTRQMVDLQVGLGVDPTTAATGDLRFSDDLVLAFTSAGLVGPLADHYPQVRFVGPSVEQRPEPIPFDWDWLDRSTPTVLVSLGTVSAAMGSRFFTVAIEALSGRDLQAVFVVPDDVAATLPPHGDNILIARRVPQLALLRHVDAVVCHGGHNTVCEALALGLPLVVAPVRDDHPLVADQVVAAGAGLRVKFGRIRAPALAEAVDAALNDPALRAGAARVKDSFDQAGGAPAAAAAVEGLLCRATL